MIRRTLVLTYFLALPYALLTVEVNHRYQSDPSFALLDLRCIVGSQND